MAIIPKLSGWFFSNRKLLISYLGSALKTGSTPLAQDSLRVAQGGLSHDQDWIRSGSDYLLIIYDWSGIAQVWKRKWNLERSLLASDNGGWSRRFWSHFSLGAKIIPPKGLHRFSNLPRHGNFFPFEVGANFWGWHHCTPTEAGTNFWSTGAWHQLLTGLGTNFRDQKVGANPLVAPTSVGQKVGANLSGSESWCHTNGCYSPCCSSCQATFRVRYARVSGLRGGSCN